MALALTFSASTGRTLFATLERLSDAFYWDQTATAWANNPAAADRKIPLTEGTGAEVCSYTASVAGLGDAGGVRIRLHDDADAADKVIGTGGVYILGGNEFEETTISRLDVAVSTRLAAADYTAPPAVGLIADAVWDELQAGHTLAGSFGLYLDTEVSSRLSGSMYTTPPTAITIASLVWDLDATGHQTQGSFGQVLGDSGADTNSVWALVNASLDATISSSLASASYTTPPTVGLIADAVWDEERAGHTTAGTFGFYLDAQVSLVSSSGSVIAAAFLDELLATHTIAGSVGSALGRIGTGRITTVSPVAAGGRLTLYRGDAYTTGLGRALEWDDTDAEAAWPVLTEAAITLEIDEGTVVIAGSVVVATGAGKRVRAEPLSSETQLLAPGVYDYRVVATFAGTGTGTEGVGEDSRATLAAGLCEVFDREDT